jgi:hypothetical protein
MATNPELDSKLVENQQPSKVTLTLDINTLNVVMAGLQDLPFKVADSVIRDIIAQAQPQLKQ